MTAPQLFAARDGTRIAVHRVGTGPPVLCVPGGPGRASSYLEDLGGLAETFTLLLMDNRGSGASELPDNRATLAFPCLADDVEDVCRALEIEQVDVIAHSAGCLVALAHAARYPGRVRRLVLVTPSGRRLGANNDDVEAIRAARAGEPWYAEAQEAAVLLATDARPGLRGELERATRPFSYGRWDARTQAHAAGTDEQMSLRAWAGFDPGDAFDSDAFVREVGTIRAPVLAVVGERDGLTGAAAGARFAALVPNGRSVTIARAGHYPWVDEPEGFRTVVIEFLTPS